MVGVLNQRVFWFGGLVWSGMFDGKGEIMRYQPRTVDRREVRHKNAEARPQVQLVCDEFRELVSVSETSAKGLKSDYMVDVTVYPA